VRIADIDLTLVTMVIPDMGGCDATKYIRKQNKWTELPVIALTAKAMIDGCKKRVSAGAND
jgi:CheY-like chemotaxis protein